MYPLKYTEEFPLPQVIELLAPYIKTRQEALRIRRILSLYLAQSIDGGPGNPLSLTSLAVPREDAQVKRIPPGFSGLRRNYLKALQAHIKAREEFNQLVRGPDEASLHALRQEQHKSEKEAATHVETSLGLLSAQQKYQKLRILQDYLDKLSQKDAAQADYLSVEKILKGVPQAPELPSPAIRENLAASETTQELTLRLEKAVLRAKNALETEKRLLAHLKSQQQAEEGSENPKPTSISAQVSALTRTRDELVNWIEQQLAQSSQAEDTLNDLPKSIRKKIPLDVDQRRKDIEAKYEEYLQARQSLIALVSARSLPSLEKSVTKQDISTSDHQNKSPEEPISKVSLILPYLTEHIIPAKNAQQGFLQQELHLSKTLADQERKTVHMLERLADESHLLSNYPFLAAQPRFQNAVAALGSKSRPKLARTGDLGARREAHIVSQARAWAFAASAAKSAKDKEIQERLDHAEKNVGIAKERLQELNEILGVDPEPQGEGEGSRAEDLVGKSKRKALKKPIDNRGLGIWAGLDGNFRVPGDSHKAKP